jgi:hypothetical protein
VRHVATRAAYEKMQKSCGARFSPQAVSPTALVTLVIQYKEYN